MIPNFLARTSEEMVMPFPEMGKTSEEARLFLIVFVFKEERSIKSSPLDSFLKDIMLEMSFRHPTEDNR